MGLALFRAYGRIPQFRVSGSAKGFRGSSFRLCACRVEEFSL